MFNTLLRYQCGQDECEDISCCMPTGSMVLFQVVCVNKDGHVVVAWVGGSGNQCAYKPQDLYKVESEVIVHTYLIFKLNQHGALLHQTMFKKQF